MTNPKVKMLTTLSLTAEEAIEGIGLQGVKLSPKLLLYVPRTKTQLNITGGGFFRGHEFQFCNTANLLALLNVCK